jgi:predicted Zn-dependent protease
MQLEWQAHYLDGKTPVRRAATVQLQPAHLRIAIEGGEPLYWPYESIRQTQGAYAGEQVRLERGEEFPELLLIGDEDFLRALHHFAPGRAGAFHDPARRQARLRGTIVAGVVSIVLLALVYLYGIPLLAAAVTPWVPISWEEKFGAVIIENIAVANSRCNDPERQQIIDKLMRQLTGALPRSPYTIHLFVINNPTINALAAPGGYIVVFRGLIEAVQTPDELAGVLAHELQHVLRRHSTRLLLQNFSTGLLMAALVGDVSGLASFGLDAAKNLMLLRYNRSHETEADEAALRTLIAANINPAGMISFFEMLKQKERDENRYLEYFSSHPSTQARVDRLRAMIAERSPGHAQPLSKQEWQELKTICRDQPPIQQKTKRN